VVFGVLNARGRDVIARAATAVRAAVREALRPAPMVSGFVADLFRGRDELLAEDALLRQQLIVATSAVKQTKFRPLERGLVVALSSVVEHWQNTVLLVKSDTVLRWHREGFRLLWKRKSRATKQRQPRISVETIELIRDMAIRNKTWGAFVVSRSSSAFGWRSGRSSVTSSRYDHRAMASRGRHSHATPWSGPWTLRRCTTCGSLRLRRSLAALGP